MALTLALKKLLPFTLQLFTGLSLGSLRQFLSRMFNFQYIFKDWLTVFTCEAHFRINMTQNSWSLPWRSSKKPTPLKVVLIPLWIWNTFNSFSTGRLNQSQREELALIEQAYDNPHECQQSFSMFSDLSNLSLNRSFSYQASPSDSACLQRVRHWIFRYLRQIDSLLWYRTSWKNHRCCRPFLFLRC